MYRSTGEGLPCLSNFPRILLTLDPPSASGEIGALVSSDDATGDELHKLTIASDNTIQVNCDISLALQIGTELTDEFH